MVGSVGRGHVVRGFGLDEASEDVGGGVELVLVVCVVLDAVGPEPYVGSFDVESTAGQDGDLRGPRIVHVVVRGPEPVVLEVGAVGSLGYVHVRVGGHAFGFDGADGGRALCDLEVCAFGAADAGVDVPEAGAALGVEVVLDYDGSWGGALGLDDHVGPFDAAALAGFADLHDGDGGVFVGEDGARAHD